MNATTPIKPAFAPSADALLAGVDAVGFSRLLSVEAAVPVVPAFVLEKYACSGACVLTNKGPHRVAAGVVEAEDARVVLPSVVLA